MNSNEQDALAAYATGLGYTEQTQGMGTSIHYTQLFNPSTFNSGHSVYTSMRDYCLAKSQDQRVKVTVGVGDILTDFILPDGSSVVRQWLSHQPQDFQNALGAELQGQSVGATTLWAVVNAFLQNSAYPAGTDASTAAAILYNWLFSDHLPVVVQYELT